LLPEEASDDKLKIEYPSPCSISVEYSNPLNTWKVPDLRQLTYDSRSQSDDLIALSRPLLFATRRTPKPFRFAIPMIYDEQKTEARGELFYMPRSMDGETHPDLVNQNTAAAAASSRRRHRGTGTGAAAGNGNADSKDDEMGMGISNDDGESMNADQQSTSMPEEEEAFDSVPASMIDVYWCGRLLPKSDCKHLFFMNAMKIAFPSQFRRLKGRLYLSPPFLPDPHKQRMCDEPISSVINQYDNHDVIVSSNSLLGGGAQNLSAVVLDDAGEADRRAGDIETAFTKRFKEWMAYDASYIVSI
jgi:hypothetical protein